jgi:hypothetical protein
VVDLVFADGRIEIEVAPADVQVEPGRNLPRVVPPAEMPALTDTEIRETLESTRR